MCNFGCNYNMIKISPCWIFSCKLTSASYTFYLSSSHARYFPWLVEILFGILSAALIHSSLQVLSISILNRFLLQNVRLSNFFGCYKNSHEIKKVWILSNFEMLAIFGILTVNKIWNAQISCFTVISSFCLPKVKVTK